MSKSKEEMLREEVRFYADMGQKYMQWGLTVMASVQTAIFFVRQQLTQRYTEAGLIGKSQELPAYRYLLGTVFLLAAAFVLSRFSNRVANQYRFYKNQLIESGESGINDQATSGVSNWVIYLYFTFPVFDVLARLWVEFHISIHL